MVYIQPKNNPKVPNVNLVDGLQLIVELYPQIHVWKGNNVKKNYINDFDDPLRAKLEQLLKSQSVSNTLSTQFFNTIDDDSNADKFIVKLTNVIIDDKEYPLRVLYYFTVINNPTKSEHTGQPTLKDLILIFYGRGVQYESGELNPALVKYNNIEYIFYPDLGKASIYYVDDHNNLSEPILYDDVAY